MVGALFPGRQGATCFSFHSLASPSGSWSRFRPQGFLPQRPDSLGVEVSLLRGGGRGLHIASRALPLRSVEAFSKRRADRPKTCVATAFREGIAA